MGRAVAKGPGHLGSILGHVVSKTLEMVLDTSFLNTQLYKVRIMGKVEQSRERNSALPYTLSLFSKLFLGFVWFLYLMAYPPL